jgi:glycosyltransferase involved in cell wall biosynthesis
MHIIQLTPGSGDNFYCENCLRDLAMVKALRQQGHEVTLIPMYLPLQIKRPEPLKSAPIFFGGLNVYLQQKSVIFRKLPAVFDRWLDSPFFLRPVARLSSMTTSNDLGATTISMLEGREGRQEKEIDRLLDWLEGQGEKPDVVLLSNALLSGLAEPLRRRLNCPIACLLQDEDGFLDGLGEPWSAKAWDRVKANAQHIDCFISVSHYFKNVMAERLQLENVSVVYTGVDTDFFVPAAGMPKQPTIGYLAHIQYDNGLDILLQAFKLLVKKAQFKEAKLLVTGGSLGSDDAFIARVKQYIKENNLEEGVTFISDYSKNERLRFLQQLSVICVPTRKPVACGLFALEAMACHVPFVEPARGVFVELAELGGGILYETDEAEQLANSLESILSSETEQKRLRSEAGRVARLHFAAEKTAAELVACLQNVLF